MMTRWHGDKIIVAKILRKKVGRSWPEENCHKLAKTGQKLAKDAKNWQKLAKVVQSWQKLSKTFKSWQKLPTIVKSCQQLSKVANIYQKLSRVAKNYPTLVESCQKLAAVAKGCQKRCQIPENSRQPGLLLSLYRFGLENGKFWKAPLRSVMKVVVMHSGKSFVANLPSLGFWISARYKAKESPPFQVV